MTLLQQMITIGLCVVGTMSTRFLPSAVFGMLVVYCLRDVSLLQGNHGLFEFLSILATGALHLWKRQMLLSIAGGTICYMILLQFFA